MFSTDKLQVLPGLAGPEAEYIYPMHRDTRAPDSVLLNAGKDGVARCADDLTALAHDRRHFIVQSLQ